MTSISLNISGKIDSGSVEICAAVSEVCSQLEIPYVVVGASARDMVLHYGHGAKIQRATSDLDFGIQVPDWTAVEVLKAVLIEAGFRETKAAHRLISPANIQMDIVPFGELEDGEANIRWPPKGAFLMNVLGFWEVCEAAQIVRVQDNPGVDVPVATPPGMAILKLIAWIDRAADLRRKDARDLVYLLTTYEQLTSVSDCLHEDQALMERYDWDIQLAGSHQLGIDAASVALKQTSKAIATLFENGNPKLSQERLIEEMCEHVDREYVRNEELISAFADGFSG